MECGLVASGVSVDGDLAVVLCDFGARCNVFETGNQYTPEQQHPEKEGHWRWILLPHHEEGEVVVCGEKVRLIGYIAESSVLELL